MTIAGSSLLLKQFTILTIPPICDRRAFSEPQGVERIGAIGDGKAIELAINWVQGAGLLAILVSPFRRTTA
jgi:hypothetical protein